MMTTDFNCRIECHPLERILRAENYPITKTPPGRYALHGVASPTGKKTKRWWGGMEGGLIEIDEYEATISDDERPELNGLIVVGCYQTDFHGRPLEPYYFEPTRLA